MKQKLLVSVLATLLSGVVFADEHTSISQNFDVDDSEITITQTGGGNHLEARQERSFQNTITATITGGNNENHGNNNNPVNLISQRGTDNSTIELDVSGSRNKFSLAQESATYSNATDNIQNINISGSDNALVANQHRTNFSFINTDIRGDNNEVAAIQTGSTGINSGDVNSLTAYIGAYGDNNIINLCQGDDGTCEIQGDFRFNTREGNAETLSLIDFELYL